jgi:hypothetical protein
MTSKAARLELEFCSTAAMALAAVLKMLHAPPSYNALA